ncbi:MAG: hypothetical protein P8M72_11255 [Gammaproteobacteria bacterium]|nr:hypothetical protein [Gammaproteobacteria bacterium]
MLKLIKPISMLLMALFISSCSTQSVKTTTFTPIVSDNTSMAESELLDIGIAIFQPGLDDIPRNREELTFSDVRMAETYFASFQLAQALQNSGNWGVVRVVPGDLSSTDVAITGTILQSDGETMKLQVNVKDSTGRTWMNKEYEEVVSKFSYDPRMRRSEDAFQGLFNRIANDLYNYKSRSVEQEDIQKIRTISQIQFARGFAPQVFDDYLEEGRGGALELTRLPAENDPILNRIETIRERDYLYVDALQDYYSTFVRQMAIPYTEFRRMSYDEVMTMDRLAADARRNMIMGVAAILGGIAATQSNNAAAYYSSPVIIASGGWLIKDAFDSGDERQLHIEMLAELGNSLEMEIAPRTIELEERTITLSGSVEDQYDQWRDILADIYANDVGEAASSD